MAEKFEGLGADYWEENYSSPEEMDGIFNAVNHARYAKNFFLIESVEVNSIIDFGFGLGHMFVEFLKSFRPTSAFGIEPSAYPFKYFQSHHVKKIPKYINFNIE